jgi:hypothetical protein
MGLEKILNLMFDEVTVVKSEFIKQFFYLSIMVFYYKKVISPSFANFLILANVLVLSVDMVHGCSSTFSGKEGWIDM